MTTISKEQATELELMAEHNDGKCGHCFQTIKIYRYKLNRVHALFMRALGDAVRNQGVNDVDLGTINIPYSMRTQNSKLRQHGLIARVKDARGVQLPRRWLVTHKGWDFLSGKPVQEKVVIYNNQVLGHDGSMVSIHDVLGEKPNPSEPLYEETPVSQPEARTYTNLRQPKRRVLKMRALFRGRTAGQLTEGEVYDIELEQLMVGRPVKMLNPVAYDYKDVAAFQKQWKVT